MSAAATNSKRKNGIGATEVESQSKSKKFIGIRLDKSEADRIQDMAEERNVSVNELLGELISQFNDPNPKATAVRRFGKRLDRERVAGDELHVKLDRLHGLIKLKDELTTELGDLNKDRPDDIFDAIFRTKRLREWEAKAKDLKEKYERLEEKIRAMRKELLAQELESVEAKDDALADVSVLEEEEQSGEEVEQEEAQEDRSFLARAVKNFNDNL